MGRLGRYTFRSALPGFFALPMLWLAAAPLDRDPTLEAGIPSFTLHKFSVLLKDPYALPSLWNSVSLAGGTALLTVTFTAAAAYALSRVPVPGRDGKHARRRPPRPYFSLTNRCRTSMLG